MAPYRILVVDDSAFMRKLFTDIIESDSTLNVVATADNGASALELVELHQPDAITLDLEMPVMNGLEALREIMARKPVPVIMLSGISEENTRGTIAALQLGAFDFIRKPSGLSADIDQVAEALLIRLKLAVKIRRSQPEALPSGSNPPAVSTGPNGRRTASRKDPERLQAPDDGSRQAAKPAGLDPAKAKKEKPPNVERIGRPAAPATPSVQPPTAGSSSFRHIVGVGTSTGGPRALHQLLSALPGDLPAPILVVQHMPPKFTHSLAQRLDSFSQLTVKEAEQEETIRSRTVYIAPGGYHMQLDKYDGEYRIKLTQDEPRNGHRPSVDLLFESLAEHTELSRHAVVMTGMGSDGARGMKLLADRGAMTTIAESEETCVVYGMPRAAVEAGGISTVLPLHDIASELTAAVKK
jgi:two-component system, chemotaxis family, protein-glutamate methylesterase/glutaminase